MLIQTYVIEKNSLAQRDVTPQVPQGYEVAVD
jgi:hypothetical protein